MICFISGGVRSGKSRFAERYVKERCKKVSGEGYTHTIDSPQGGRKSLYRRVYIATSIPYDEEMKARVKRHQEDRALDHWVTIEKPYNLREVIPMLLERDVVLIDCLTILLSNEMFCNGIKIDVVDKILSDIHLLSQRVKDLVIVSNDIFSNAMEFTDYTDEYIKNLGRLHIKIARLSDEAYECVYGTNILRKGERL